MFDYTNLKSIMADRPSDNTTDKYSFVSTKAVINLLEKNGWIVSSARESRTTKYAGFQQHVVRFRRIADIGRILEVNEIVMEVILRTAHNGTSLWEFGGGFQRCWCDNQCTVSAGTVAEHKIKHVGFTDMKVLNAINSIAKDMPNIIGRMNDFKEVKLNDDERFIFGMNALDLMFEADKWEKYNKVESAKRLTEYTRPQDKESNLWNIYNIVQEKFIKGGDFLLTPHQVDYYRTYRNGVGAGDWSRGIKSITRDLIINKKLWELAEDTEKLLKSV